MHLSVRPPIHPPAHLSIHPFNHLSIHLQPAGHASTHPSIRSLSLHSLVHHPFIPLTVHSVHTPSCPPTHEAIYPRTQRLCTFLTFHVSTDFLKRASRHPSTHPTTYLSVHVNRRLSVHTQPSTHTHRSSRCLTVRSSTRSASQPARATIGQSPDRPAGHRQRPDPVHPWGHGRLWGAAPSQSGAGARSTPRPCGGFGAHAAPSVRRAGPDLEGRGGRPAAGGAVHGHAGAGAGAAGGARPAGACTGEPRDCQLRTGTWPGRRLGAPLPTRSRGHLPAPEPQFPVGTSCWEGHCLDELERLGEPKLVGVLGSRSLLTRPPTGPGDSRGQRGQGLGAHAQQQGELRGPALPVRAPGHSCGRRPRPLTAATGRPAST